MSIDSLGMIWRRKIFSDLKLASCIWSFNTGANHVSSVIFKDWRPKLHLRWIVPSTDLCMLLDLLIRHEKPCLLRGRYQLFLYAVEGFCFERTVDWGRNVVTYIVYIILLYFKEYDPDSVKIFSMYLNLEACWNHSMFLILKYM